MALEPIIHADGVYFGLPEADHHADPALGSTDLKRLLISGPRYWAQSSWAGPWREGLEIEPDDKETKAKQFGSATHVMVLMGRAAFEAAYYAEPAKPKGYLETKEHLMQALRERVDAGLVPPDLGVMIPVKSATRGEWLKACRKAGVGPLIDDWKDEQAVLASERETISNKWATTLLLIDRMLDAPRYDLGGKSQRQMFLTGGQPEVSIFWTDDRGIRLKARIDYLRIKGSIDVKTYGAREDQECVTAFCGSVANYAYDMQAIHYQDARAQIGRLRDEGSVYLCTEQTEDVDGVPHKFTVTTQARSDFAIMEWLRKVAEEEDPPWLWVGVQTFGMPETDVFPFKGSLTAAAAAFQVQLAKDNFVSFRDRYGMTDPWVSDRGVVELDDMVFEAVGRARRMMDRGSTPWK